MASFLDPVLNPIMQPILNQSPLAAIALLAFIISLAIVVVYKYATNQEEMGRLKGQQKDFQKRMRALREKPEEMMSVQKEAMKVNMEYMKHSFKATLITMLPILLIFGWMSAHLAYEPIYPGERYSITATFGESVNGEAELIVDEGTEVLNEQTQQINSGVTWNLQSTEGEHGLYVKVGNDQQKKDVLITRELKYADQVVTPEHSDIQKIEINYNKLRPLGSFSIFGWQPGWLSLYIIFSIVFSIVLRKVFKVH